MLLAGLALAGCDNPCQQLCDELANYAADCGYTVSPDQVEGCKADYAKADLDDGVLQSCADHNDPDALREWWTCEDVAENFSASTQ